jgi:hypothetical protein
LPKTQAEQTKINAAAPPKLIFGARRRWFLNAKKFFDLPEREIAIKARELPRKARRRAKDYYRFAAAREKYKFPNRPRRPPPQSSPRRPK